MVHSSPSPTWWAKNVSPHTHARSHFIQNQTPGSTAQKIAVDSEILMALCPSLLIWNLTISMTATAIKTHKITWVLNISKPVRRREYNPIGTFYHTPVRMPHWTIQQIRQHWAPFTRELKLRAQTCKFGSLTSFYSKLKLFRAWAILNLSTVCAIVNGHAESKVLFGVWY